MQGRQMTNFFVSPSKVIAFKQVAHSSEVQTCKQHSVNSTLTSIKGFQLDIHLSISQESQGVESFQHYR